MNAQARPSLIFVQITCVSLSEEFSFSSLISFSIMVKRWDREKPALVNLCSELLWPDVIRRAHSHPEEVVWRDSDGGTAFHHACRFLEAGDAVREMLKTCESACYMQDKDGSTPLHVACWNGSDEVIQLLVAANRDVVSIVDKNGRTPLHLACSSWPPPSDSTIELLLKADPEMSMVADTNGRTPLNLLCSRHEQRMQMAMESIEHGMDSEAVYKGILAPFWKQMRLVLEASVGEKFAAEDNWKLVHACTTIPDCPQYLFELALKLHPEQVQEKLCGFLPLHLAAECPTSQLTENHCDGFYVCLLLSLFPKACRITDKIGRLPLHIAVQSGKSWEHVLRKIFEAYPEALLLREGENYLLPFMAAARSGESNDPRASRVSRLPPNYELTSALELLRADPSGIKHAIAV
jgi:hypothetical protein